MGVKEVVIYREKGPGTMCFFLHLNTTQQPETSVGEEGEGFQQTYIKRKGEIVQHREVKRETSWRTWGERIKGGAGDKGGGLSGNSSAFRSMAVVLHIPVCRWVSPSATASWRTPARLGSCSRRRSRTLGRALGRWEGGWGCTARTQSLGVGR